MKIILIILFLILFSIIKYNRNIEKLDLHEGFHLPDDYKLPIDFRLPENYKLDNEKLDEYNNLDNFKKDSNINLQELKNNYIYLREKDDDFLKELIWKQNLQLKIDELKKNIDKINTENYGAQLEKLLNSFESGNFVEQIENNTILGKIYEFIETESSSKKGEEKENFLNEKYDDLVNIINNDESKFQKFINENLYYKNKIPRELEKTFNHKKILEETRIKTTDGTILLNFIQLLRPENPNINFSLSNDVSIAEEITSKDFKFSDLKNNEEFKNKIYESLNNLSYEKLLEFNTNKEYSSLLKDILNKGDLDNILKSKMNDLPLSKITELYYDNDIFRKLDVNLKNDILISKLENPQVNINELNKELNKFNKTPHILTLFIQKKNLYPKIIENFKNRLDKFNQEYTMNKIKDEDNLKDFNNNFEELSYNFEELQKDINNYNRNQIKSSLVYDSLTQKKIKFTEEQNKFKNYYEKNKFTSISKLHELMQNNSIKNFDKLTEKFKIEDTNLKNQIEEIKKKLNDFSIDYKESENNSEEIQSKIDKLNKFKLDEINGGDDLSYLSLRDGSWISYNNLPELIDFIKQTKLYENDENNLTIEVDKLRRDKNNLEENIKQSLGITEQTSEGNLLEIIQNKINDNKEKLEEFSENNAQLKEENNKLQELYNKYKENIENLEEKNNKLEKIKEQHEILKQKYGNLYERYVKETEELNKKLIKNKKKMNNYYSLNLILGGVLFFVVSVVGVILYVVFNRKPDTKIKYIKTVTTKVGKTNKNLPKMSKTTSSSGTGTNVSSKYIKINTIKVEYLIAFTSLSIVISLALFVLYVKKK